MFREVSEENGGYAERNQEEKNTSPGAEIDDEAANRWPDKKTKMVRHGHQALGFSFGAFRHRLHGQRSAGGVNDGSPDPLKKPEQHQLPDVL